MLTIPMSMSVEGLSPMPTPHELTSAQKKYVTVNVEAGGTFSKATEILDEDSHLVEMERIKNDIVHIFLRFQRVVSTLHGCFKAFMVRLSDAFFIPSHSDIDFIKTVLKACGHTDEEIKSKPWHFYKSSIRRTVPGPKALEENLQKVFDLFADEVDAKTGKKFFGEENSKARKLAINVMEHVRIGCLSDIPGMSYYVQIGEDSMGIPQYKCIRGTSALKGFHQKIRQLIRGFAISPRFAIALLFEFVHRWNHDIDCRILGRSGEYAHCYDGFAIEEEMEFTRGWDLEKRPHSDWLSTLDFASTREIFGILGRSHEIGNDNELDNQIKAIMEALDSGLLHCTEEEIEEQSCSFSSLPESSAWLSRELRTKRPMRGVRTPTECEFFDNNYLRFQSFGSKEEADNFSSIQFGAFSILWNEIIMEEEEGKRPKTDMTLKSAYHLAEHAKELKRKSNASLTMLGIADHNKELRQELRGRDRADKVQIPNAVAARDAVDKGDVADDTSFPPGDDGSNNDTSFPPVNNDRNDDVDNQEQTQQVLGRQGTGRVIVQLFSVAQSDSTPTYTAAKPHKQRLEQKKKRAPARCRQCGHAVKDPKWAQYHRQPGFTAGNRTHKCTVEESERKPGFPWPIDQRLPPISQ